MALTNLDNLTKIVQRASGSSPSYSRNVARRIAKSLNAQAKKRRQAEPIKLPADAGATTRKAKRTTRVR